MPLNSKPAPSTFSLRPSVSFAPFKPSTKSLLKGHYLMIIPAAVFSPCALSCVIEVYACRVRELTFASLFEGGHRNSPAVCGLHRRGNWNHFTSKQSPAGPGAPFSPTKLWHIRHHHSTLNLYSRLPKPDCHPCHTCLALSTHSNTHSHTRQQPPLHFSPLSAPQSKWLITNLTSGNLQASAHLWSLRAPLHREPN